MTRKHSLPRILTVLAAALCLAAALPLMAQGPGFGPGHGPGPGAGPGAAFGPADGQGPHLGRLAGWLELTDEQIEAARALFETVRTEAEPLRDEQKALRDELRTVLEADAPDATEVGTLVLALHDNRQEIRGLREAAWADFEALLTPEQLEKLEQLQAVRQHFGRRGPGRAAGGSSGPGFGPGA